MVSQAKYAASTMPPAQKSAWSSMVSAYDSAVSRASGAASAASELGAKASAAASASASRASSSYAAATAFDVDPAERAQGARLCDAGLWTARELDSLHKCFERMRRKDAHHHVAADPKRLPTFADFHRYFRLEETAFTHQVLLLPKAISVDGVEAADVAKLTLNFAEFGLSVWVLCSFELATLAFAMMDVDQRGELTRDQVRLAVARTYSIHAMGRRGMDIFDGTKSVDTKLKRVMEGLDVNASGRVSRAEFVAFAHRYHYMLLPAFGVQRSVRERIFGTTVRWAHVEREKARGAAGRTIQQVVSEVAKLIPEMGRGGAVDARPTEAYLRETDPDRLLEMAAEAYRRGDYDRAKAIYAYHKSGGCAPARDGALYQNPAMLDLALDSKPAAAAANLSRKVVQPNGPSRVINPDDRAFGGKHYVDNKPAHRFGR
ncbi:hypothetical protein M885DRAFT_622280 [Pelagophyceae sp. CCMP2097]|nr:hypothetical protein M885DRAFT_622280 [Pelagophyceae sp. CCMP2097]|mmetsp:Transcript_18772/g.63408  ORF Transcript_18772/g.63408 Transcript_18772/m.63408 type:complete len:432 (+) Transcript_18772:170-1465(+)